MKATHLMLAVSVTCGLLLGASADAITYTGLDEHEVVGLHKILRKFKRNGAIQRETTGGGSLVRTHFKVTGCPKMDDAFRDSWSCFAEVKSTFRIKNKFHQGDSVQGGSAQVVSGADGDKMIFEERVEYAWDAEDEALNIIVSYADGASGVVKRWGTYNVRGKTTQKVTTATNSFNANVDLLEDGLDLGFDVTKAESKKTAKLKIVIEGSPWYGETGLVSLVRLPGSTETIFITEINWLTDAEIDYEEEAPVVTTSCSGSFTVNGTASFRQQTQTGSVTAGSSETVDCRTTSEALTATVHWRAMPSFASNAQDGVGQRTFNRIVVRQQSSTSHTAHYEAGFDSLINWSLDVETANGTTLGGGFEVSSTQNVSGLLKGPIYHSSF